MKRITLESLVVVSIVSALLAGCGGGGGGTSTPPQVEDVVVDQKQGSIGPDGGEISLRNGATLTVPAGALPATVMVKLTQLEKPKYFGAFAIAYEIVGLSSLQGTAQLSIPVGKTKNGEEIKKEEISILLFDPTPIAGEPFQVKEQDFQYDTAAQNATVTISPTKQSRKGILERLRFVFQLEKEYLPKVSEKLIHMPYYEQVGGSCWATATMMLARAFKTDAPGFHLGKILAYVKASDDDFGIGVLGFQTVMLQYLAVYSKATVQWRGYVRMQHLKWRMLRELEAGHPLILRFPRATGGYHVVLVVGYRDYGKQFVMHDPQGISPPNQNEGGAYTVRDFDWIVNQRGNSPLALQIAWPDSPLPQNRTLQTVGCPGGDEQGGSPFGKIQFYGLNLETGNEGAVARLQFRPSTGAEGYCWMRMSEVLSEIPNIATRLRIDVPVWNAERSPVSTKLKVSLNTGSTRLTTWEAPLLNLPSAGDNDTIKQNVRTDIELGPPGRDGAIRRYDLADDKGNQKITIWVDLEGADGSYKDNYYLDVTLSLLPMIGKIEPTSVTPGGKVTINGLCFGDKQSSRAKVLLNGKEMVILSWSDRKIEVKVPDNAVSGSLVVTTGERYSYTSNAKQLTVFSGVVEESFNYKKEYTITKPLDTTLYTVYDDGTTDYTEIVFGAKAKGSIEGKMQAPAGTTIELAPDSLPHIFLFNIHFKKSQQPIKIEATINNIVDPKTGFKDNGAPPGDEYYGYAKYSVTKYEVSDEWGTSGVTYNVTPLSEGFKLEIQFEPRGTGSWYDRSYFYWEKEVKDPRKQPNTRSGKTDFFIFRFDFLEDQ